MSGRPWTKDELQTLRELYGRTPAPVIAERLGRTVRSVWMQAAVIGLANRRRPYESRELATIRALNAKGWSDTEIAERLGRERHRLGSIRRQMGLPCNAKSKRVRRKIAAGVQAQCERLGVKRMAELRTVAFSRFAKESGWPDDLPPRCVQILNVLAARGVPMTKRELAEAIGMRTDHIGGNGYPEFLKGNVHGTYTAQLLRCGMLSRIRRGAKVTGRGKGHSQDLYLLGPAALAILQERAKCQATATENSA